MGCWGRLVGHLRLVVDSHLVRAADTAPEEDTAGVAHHVEVGKERSHVGRSLVVVLVAGIGVARSCRRLVVHRRRTVGEGSLVGCRSRLVVGREVDLAGIGVVARSLDGVEEGHRIVDCTLVGLAGYSRIDLGLGLDLVGSSSLELTC